MDIEIDDHEGVIFLPYDEIVTLSSDTEIFIPIIQNIITRLRYLSRHCDNDFTSICPRHRQNHCGPKSGIAMYTKGISYNNPKEFIEKYNNYVNTFDDGTDPIRGYLIYIITNENICEIYDVCSSQSSRGKGYMKKIFLKLFEEIKKDDSIKKIWLGIDFKNPFFEQAISLYTSVGFKYPTMNNSTSDLFPAGINFIELTYKIDEPVDLSLKYRNKIKETSIMVKNNVISRFVSCSLNIHFHKNITDNLKNLTYSTIEKGGVFTIRTSSTYNNTLYYNIDYPSSLQIDGQYGSVDTPVSLNIKNKNIKNNCFFNFHTHPSECYIKEKCSIGWTSGQDMLSVIYYYMNYNILKHYVVTIEGIYSIGLTVGFKYFLKQMDIVLGNDCILKFLKVIKYMFDYTEKHRATSSILKKHGSPSPPKFVKKHFHERLLLPLVMTSFLLLISSFRFKQQFIKIS